MIERLDHINIRTAKLDAMVDWYGEVLGMTPGPRPDFGIPGAWLYANGQPLVHLVEVPEEPSDPGTDLKLEHGAFSAKGFERFHAALEARGERMRILKVPGFPLVQVNIWDPDGNHLHIDFDADEVDPAFYS
ncbi:VOC family protein [Aestuariicoccus sp. MJ-SS9]|uniref:VOC family protein n=1 Tax=Aestuariicoccus sp. MJ-SS9 TaxID=3079855 RepID=UPI0029063790|nr:VOC family protein [Aestuariicoccus sp. MJ-SS9]MDU8910799.1 VOC family protein [Aestuariicoccus sp. MJ-SS9]